MSEPWAVVAAALGSSLLTSAGTFGLVRWQAVLHSRAASGDRLRLACVQLASRGHSLALRAGALRQTALSRSGLGEGIDVAFRYRKPFDQMELHDWLAVDLTPMLEAQSVIEVTADEEIIQAGSELVLTASSVLNKATSFAATNETSPGNWSEKLVRWVRALRPLHPDPETEEALTQAVRELARQQRRFTSLTRDRLGVNDPEAVIRAFPEMSLDTAGSADPESAAPGTNPGSGGAHGHDMEGTE